MTHYVYQIDIRNWVIRKEEVVFPPCYFGVKHFNHVDDTILGLSILGNILFLILTLVCAFYANGQVWLWPLSFLGLCMLTMAGNMFGRRWLYAPIWLVLSFFTTIWVLSIWMKIGYDLLALNQAYLPRIFGHDVASQFPELSTDQRINVLVYIIMEFLLLVPSYFTIQLIKLLTKGFLYLEQLKKSPVLPFTMVNPSMSSNNTECEFDR